MLAKSTLNSIETLVSQALIDMEISHDEFIAILKRKIYTRKGKKMWKKKKKNKKTWDWIVWIQENNEFVTDVWA